MTTPARADHAPHRTSFTCPDCGHPFHGDRVCKITRGQGLPCGCERS